MRGVLKRAGVWLANALAVSILAIALTGTGLVIASSVSSVTPNGAVTTGTLAQFAATTSAQLAGVLSDETGTGSDVFGTSPTFTTSAIFGADAASNTTLPASATIRGGNTLTGGTSDQNAGTLTIQSGTSKGSGTGIIDFKVSPSAGSGSTLNTPVTILSLRGAQTPDLASAANNNVEAAGIWRFRNIVVFAGTGNVIASSTLSNSSTLTVDTSALINFNGSNRLVIPDNSATALRFDQGGNNYLVFDTTNGGELVTHQKPIRGTIATPVAAAGNAITNCGAIPAGTVWIHITGNDDTKGVCLPTTTSVTTCVQVMAETPSTLIAVNALKVYGAEADTNPTVNGGAADAAYLQPGGTSLTYCNSGVAWTSY